VELHHDFADQMHQALWPSATSISLLPPPFPVSSAIHGKLASWQITEKHTSHYKIGTVKNKR
jgi:hypothetical protein